MSSSALLLPERVLVAREVPSLFGGTRTRLEDGPRFVDPQSGVVGAAGLDVARLLSVDDAKGQPRRIAALCRRGADVAAPPDSASTLPLSALLSAWAASLSAVTTSLAVLPSARSHAFFGVASAALAERGVSIVDDVARDGFFVDDADVVDARAGKVVCAAGQGALLASGLAKDVVAFFVEAAGAAGADCFDKHFDDVSRAWFTQRVERALRAGFGAPVIKLSGAALVPPLPTSTSRLHALPPDASPKVRELASAHRAVQERQRAALAALQLELRLPAARASWFDEQVGRAVVVDGGSSVVVGDNAAAAALGAALAARGVVVSAANAAWFGGSDEEDDDGGADVAAPVVVVPRAVGGVRATVDFDVSVAAPVDDVRDEAPVAPPTTTAPMAATQNLREVELPARFTRLSVRVDDVVIDGASLDVRGPASAPRATLAVPVRSGSIVVVSWDSPVDEAAEAVDAAAVAPVVAPVDGAAS